jgi:hypothetical protein
MRYNIESLNRLRLHRAYILFTKFAYNCFDNVSLQITLDIIKQTTSNAQFGKCVEHNHINTRSAAGRKLTCEGKWIGALRRMVYKNLGGLL